MAATPEGMIEHCEICSAELESGQIGLCDACCEAEDAQNSLADEDQS